MVHLLRVSACDCSDCRSNYRFDDNPPHSNNPPLQNLIKNLKIPGDKLKQVHMEGYAVSAQCMALVRDDCLIPTKDAPELGYIRESSDKQYVPDVYYKVSRPIPTTFTLQTKSSPAALAPRPISCFFSYSRVSLLQNFLEKWIIAVVERSKTRP